MATPAQPLEVEVVYALPQRQQLLTLRVPPGCTAAEAIAASGLVDLPVQPWMLACFGRRIAADTPLREGDRVEVLRSLDADPKDQRRQRVRLAARARRRSA